MNQIRQRGEHQPLGRMTEIQGEPGQETLDEVLAYRLWFSGAEADVQITVENATEREAVLVVVQVMPGGPIRTLAKKVVVPGSSFVLPAAELLVATTGSILVKAPRRLELAIVGTTGERLPLKVGTDASAVFYDVFSEARQWEADQEAHRRLTGAVKQGRRVVRVLGEWGGGTEEAAVSPKQARAAAAHNGRRFFISYWVK